MALKKLIATPVEAVSNRLERFAAERVRVLRRAWENSGKKPLDPTRFRMQEAEVFRREISTQIAKLAK